MEIWTNGLMDGRMGSWVKGWASVSVRGRGTDTRMDSDTQHPLCEHNDHHLVFECQTPMTPMECPWSAHDSTTSPSLPDEQSRCGNGQTDSQADSKTDKASTCLYV